MISFASQFGIGAELASIRVPYFEQTWSMAFWKQVQGSGVRAGGFAASFLSCSISLVRALCSANFRFRNRVVIRVFSVIPAGVSW